jgi:NADH-quinone oxidoreductase subunit M
MIPSISYQSQIGFPVLSLITFIPLTGALIIMLIRQERQQLIRVVAMAVSLVDLALVLYMLTLFRTDGHYMQFVEKTAWIPSFGISYHLGVDGISLLLILLTNMLDAISILSTWNAITDRVKEFMICMLILETCVIGVFVSLDLFLFYVFWEVMLVPMYFIIAIWGGGRRLYSAVKFFIYTLIGSLIMIPGILTIYFNYHQYALQHKLVEIYTFNLLKLYQIPMSLAKQFWVFIALSLGFAIKVPMVPFHTWLPDAHSDAPTAGSVILAGVLLKVGVYGFLRISIPILPQLSRQAVPYIAVIAIVGVVYGAKLAMAQSDMKRLIAYSSVSHMGFIMLGLFLFNQRGLEGGVLQMINHGLSTGALFLIVGLLYERRHTRMIADFGGLYHRLPVFGVLFAIVTFSSIGLPGLNGFVGEFLILLGAFEANKIYAWFLVLGILLGASYMLWLYQRVMMGKLDKPENQQLKDLSPREVTTLIPIVILMFWIGLYPSPWLKLMRPAVETIIAQSRRPLDLAAKPQLEQPVEPVNLTY